MTWTTVIVTTLNRPSLLEKCLTSLCEQKLVKFDVVVIDDCSELKFSQVNETLCSPYDNVTYFRNDRNLGLAKSRMVGLKLSAGSYILFLDDDIIVCPLYVWSHVQVLSNEANACTVGALQYKPEFVKTSNSTRFLNSRELRQTFFGEMVLDGRHFGGGISGVRRTDLLAVGGFDCNFDKYGSEDVALGLKLVGLGRNIRFVSEAKADHYDKVTPFRLRTKTIENAQYGLTYLFDEFGDKSVLGKFRSCAYRLSKCSFIPIFYLSLILEYVLFKLCLICEKRPQLYSKTLYILLSCLWIIIGFNLSARSPASGSSLVTYTDPSN